MSAAGYEITLKAMRFDGSVGILPAERVATQPIEIDLVVQVRNKRDARDVLDYRALYDATADVMRAGHIDYLEEIADAISARVLALGDRVSHVRVAVRKPRVDLGGPLAFAEVVVARDAV